MSQNYKIVERLLNADRIVPADLEGDEAWRRNNSWVELKHVEQAASIIQELGEALEPFAVSHGFTEDAMPPIVRRARSILSKLKEA